jgi:hypothetical protein
MIFLVARQNGRGDDCPHPQQPVRTGLHWTQDHQQPSSNCSKVHSVVLKILAALLNINQNKLFDVHEQRSRWSNALYSQDSEAVGRACPTSSTEIKWHIWNSVCRGRHSCSSRGVTGYSHVLCGWIRLQISIVSHPGLKPPSSLHLPLYPSRSTSPSEAMLKPKRPFSQFTSLHSAPAIFRLRIRIGFVAMLIGCKGDIVIMNDCKDKAIHGDVR